MHTYTGYALRFVGFLCVCVGGGAISPQSITLSGLLRGGGQMSQCTLMMDLQRDLLGGSGYLAVS